MSEDVEAQATGRSWLWAFAQAHLGIGRTLQTLELFNDLTV
jgi:hypothetical protein